ncbi:MAG: YciI family protein [Proteobacteria bacterium]|nr:YciI family protein [Pseudomonadota bacterium]
MRMVAIFEDEPAMLAVRAEKSAAHLAYLDLHRDRILIGGGLRPAPGEAFCGGLWVLEVATREEAVALIEDDPYFDPAIRRYRLFVWGKAFEDRVVTL